MKTKMKKRTWVKTAGIILLGIGSVVLMGFLLSFLIQLVWNWLMPELFSLSRITYWQGMGLYFLARLLLGFGHEFKHDASRGGGKRSRVEKATDEAKTGRESWMHYDEWWESEGEKAFRSYVERAASKTGNEEG